MKVLFEPTDANYLDIWLRKTQSAGIIERKIQSKWRLAKKGRFKW